MTNLELAKQIVSLLGGKENVVKAANCMTRLRVTCRNTELVDKDQIKALEGVLGPKRDVAAFYLQCIGAESVHRPAVVKAFDVGMIVVGDDGSVAVFPTNSMWVSQGG